jgi:hypothetical protein
LEFSSVYVKKHSDVQVEELRAQQGSIHLVPCLDRSNVASYAFVEIGAAFIDQLDGEGAWLSGRECPRLSARVRSCCYTDSIGGMRDGAIDTRCQEICMDDFSDIEERIIYQERFQGSRLDFRGRTWFQRYDCCEFVKATLLVDDATQSLAFTNCTFEDCTIDYLSSDESRSLVARDNVFKAPIEERRSAFEKRLAEALSGRAAKK